MAATDSSTPPLQPAEVEKLRPGPDDYEVADGAAPGLRLRVTRLGKDGRSGGAKVFRWYVTSLGRVVTLGRFSAKPRPGFLTLAQARATLERLKQAHAAGKLDEAVAELKPRPVKAPAATEGGPTVRDFAAAFMESIRRRRERPGPVQDIVDDIIVAAIGDRPVASITPDDVERLIVGVVEGRHAKARNGKDGKPTGAPTHAGKVLQVAKQMFRYAESKGKVTRNPAGSLDPDDLGIVNRTCDRYLSRDEIGPFWRALDHGMSTTVRDALRLLLLLGVRSGELLQATWDEIDLDEGKPEPDREPTWTIPVAHQKLSRKQKHRGAKPFRVPLGPTAVAILRELRAFADSIGSRYVVASFAGDGAPLTDKALNHAMRRLFTGQAPALRFDGERPTPHDLRRTVRTHLAETLGVAPHLAEKTLNHSLGRVFANYDRHDYLAERRDPINRWDAYLSRLVSGQGAEIVAIPAKAVRS